LVFGVRLEVDLAALAVADAEKSDGGHTRQLSCGPQPFSREGPPCGVVNQANQKHVVGHGFKLTADRQPGQKESRIQHEYHAASEGIAIQSNFSERRVCLFFRVSAEGFTPFIRVHLCSFVA
jgi:hypothetical protein